MAAMVRQERRESHQRQTVLRETGWTERRPPQKERRKPRLYRPPAQAVVRGGMMQGQFRALRAGPSLFEVYTYFASHAREYPEKGATCPTCPRALCWTEQQDN